MTPDPRAAFDVSGRVAIITGGGRGLGRAMSEGLAKAGARIVAVGRTQEDLNRTVTEIRADGGEIIAVKADVGDYDALPGIVEATVEAFGGVDILVNNAVHPAGALIVDITPELTERVYRTNVHGPMFLAAHAVRRATDASGASRQRRALARGTGADRQPVRRCRRHGTGCQGAGERTGGWTDERRASVSAATPLERIAPFHEIVPHVLYLGSDASAFVTGTDLVVDGGVTNGRGNPNFAKQRVAMVEADATRQAKLD